MAQSVAHLIGSEEVTGSIPVASFRHIGVESYTIRFDAYFLLYRKVRPIKQKRSAKDAHLAEKKIIASQFRTGAEESQATLCSRGTEREASGWQSYDTSHIDEIL